MGLGSSIEHIRCGEINDVAVGTTTYNNIVFNLRSFEGGKLFDLQQFQRTSVFCEVFLLTTVRSSSTATGAYIRRATYTVNHNSSNPDPSFSLLTRYWMENDAHQNVGGFVQPRSNIPGPYLVSAGASTSENWINTAPDISWPFLSCFFEAQSTGNQSTVASGSLVNPDSITVRFSVQVPVDSVYWEMKIKAFKSDTFT